MVTVELTSAEAHAVLSAVAKARQGIEPNSSFADLLLDVSIKVGDAILRGQS
jgi:hypothetical protein